VVPTTVFVVVVAVFPPPPPQPDKSTTTRSEHAPRAGASRPGRDDLAPAFKDNPAISARASSPSHNFGSWLDGCGTFVTALFAVVEIVMTTFPEVPFSEDGLKLHEDAAGSPLQLNVTNPAAGPAPIPIRNWAGCPAVTVTLGVFEAIASTGPMFMLGLTVLFPSATSPVSETAAVIEETATGAFTATLNVSVISG
jgi:hypothetical protein